MPRRRDRALAALGVLAGIVIAAAVAVGAVWALLVIGRPAPSHFTVHAGTPAEAVVFTPGRSMAAYYLFVVGLTLLPPVYLAAALLLPSTRRQRGRLYFALLAGCLCLASGAAGYAIEALRSELRVSAGAIQVRAGSETAAMGWEDVRGMVLRWRPSSQRIDVVGRSKTIRIDLGAFAPPDRLLLAQGLPHLANLSNVSRGPEEQVWVRRVPGRRMERQIAPNGVQ